MSVMLTEHEQGGNVILTFLYVGYSLCAYVFMFVCMLSCECVLCVVCVKWVNRWRRVDLGSEMDLTEKVRHYPKNQTPNWYMTCVAFCRLESLSWFVQRNHSVTVLILFYTINVNVWQWASCQPQCPPSQFHCPICSHMGALQHFSTLFE